MAGSYATVGNDFDGMNFRTIARKMTRSGHKMNHATARNVLHSALRKLARASVHESGQSLTEADDLALKPEFQSALGALIQDIYSGKA